MSAVGRSGLFLIGLDNVFAACVRVSRFLLSKNNWPSRLRNRAFCLNRDSVALHCVFFSDVRGCDYQITRSVPIMTRCFVTALSATQRTPGYY